MLISREQEYEDIFELKDQDT